MASQGAGVKSWKIALFRVVERLRSSFWFVPALMVASAAALSIASIHLDIRTKDDVAGSIGWLFAGGPEGARAVLAAIAGSMITVAGVVFSVTVVILSLASQQFGPRILRTFIRDRSNQFVLGTFVATFVYCLLILRTVRGSSEEADFVPYISVTVGVSLAVLSIGVLIYFVHHSAESIQSSSLIASVGVELDGAIDRLYPYTIGEGAPRADPVLPDRNGGVNIAGTKAGYVQLVKADELLRIASSGHFVIEVSANPGSFVRRGEPLAGVYDAPEISPEVCHRIRGAFVIGEKRTAAEDIEFLFRQITEIAVRALSPGINDPFTAVECVDRLSAALQRLAGREMPSPVRRDHAGDIRVIAHPQPFTRIAHVTLGAIRRYGGSHEEVLLALLQGITVIAGELRCAEDRNLLLEEARAVIIASSQWSDQTGKRQIEEEYARAVRALSDGPAAPR